MKISVIICCHNSSDLISKALTHVYKQEGVAPDDYEVIVVDNASSDDTAGVARRTALANGRLVTVVSETTPGLVFARLAGLRAARAPIVCFVDDDNLLDQHYLSTALEVFDTYDDVGYVGGKTRLPQDFSLPPDFPFTMVSAYAIGDQYPRSGKLPRFQGYLWGAGLCLRIAAVRPMIEGTYSFALAGRTGQSQMSGDDTELCLLASSEGWRGYYDPRLLLIHAIRRERFTLEKLTKTYEGFGAARPVIDGLEINFRKATGALTLRSLLLFYAPQRAVIYSVMYLRHWINAGAGSPESIVMKRYYRAAIESSINLTFRPKRRTTAKINPMESRNGG